MATDSAAAHRRRLRSSNTGDTAAYLATIVASSSTLRCIEPPDRRRWQVNLRQCPWLTAAGGQASRYWERYRLVLVTNARDFVLVGEDADGKPATLETFRLAGSGDEFLHRLEKPRAFARAAGASLGEYLARALSHRAALAEPKDLAWLLASYARDGLARVEAAGGAPQRRCARRLRKRLAGPVRG